MTRPIQMNAARYLRAGSLRDGPAQSPRRFSALLTAGAVVAALVLSTALPARAQIEGQDLAKLLVGALVVGAIIHEVKKDDDRKPAAKPEQLVEHRPGHQPGNQPYGHYPNKPWQKPAAVRLPAVCAIEIDGSLPANGRKDQRARPVTFYPESCLNDLGLRQADLPRHCASGARLFGTRDRVYGQDCLKSAGYQVK